MKIDVDTILQEFESIENINPSIHWDFELEQKLRHSSTSKSTAASKVSLLLFLLVLLNIGFIWSSLKTESIKNSMTRNDHFQIISDELLIP